jgi:hypothetical protein
MNLGERDGLVWTGLIWVRIRSSGGLFECGNELSGSIKCSEILEKLHNWRPLV